MKIKMVKMSMIIGIIILVMATVGYAGQTLTAAPTLDKLILESTPVSG